MTKLFKNSKSVLSLVLAFAVLAVSLFTGVVINTEAANCDDTVNVVYVTVQTSEPDGSYMDGTHGTGTEADPYVISTYGQLRHLVQQSTYATTHGKFFEIDENIDILCLQGEAYIGDINTFMAKSATEVKEYFETNTTNRWIWQSSSHDSAYTDAFSGTFDGNGVKVVGMYNNNGGLFSNINEGAVLKNLTVSNSYISASWWAGAVAGAAYISSSYPAEKQTEQTCDAVVAFENIVVNNNYILNKGNAQANTGALFGMANMFIAVHMDGILTYGNSIWAETVKDSGNIVSHQFLFGKLSTGHNGDNGITPNGSYSDSVILDCAPFAFEASNQAFKPQYYSNVYTNCEEPSYGPGGWKSSLADFPGIIRINAENIKGSAAMTTMPNLDWVNTWVAVDGKYPELRSNHNITLADNGDGTHKEECTVCGLSVGDKINHSFVDGVCGCGYEAKCGENIIYWNGGLDSTLADNGETGADWANAIIIDSAEELNYLVNNQLNYAGGSSFATKDKYYKMADGIDYAILQPEGTLNVEKLLSLDGAGVKLYFEDEIGLSNLVNWETSGNEMWFGGHFDGNGVTFAGMYSAHNSAGLFATADGGAEFKNLAVVSSYIDGVAGNARTGAIVGGTCGYKYGAGVAGTVTFDTIMVANNYLHCYTNQGNGAIVMGACNDEEAVSINNAIVYGNASKYDNQGNTGLEDKTMHLYGAVKNSINASLKSTVTNSIILGTRPYYAWYDANMSGVDSLENVYTDQAANPYSQVEYAETDVKNIEGLAGAELKEACTALDWANTFLATADMPTFRAMHDAEFSATYNDETHSLSCSCGLAIESAPHDWSNKDGVCAAGCGYECLHGDGEAVISTEKTPATCTDAAWYYDECTICGFSTEEMEEGIYQDGDPLGHDMVLQEGTPAKCGVAGVKDYYDCSRCDYVSEDEAGEVEITNLDEWKVIPALEHVAAVDDQDKTIYAWDDTTPGMHYNVCDLCGEKYNGVACTGEYTYDDEGHEGKCTVCGIETEGKEPHGNFDENHKCGTCDWVCPHAEYVDGTAEGDVTTHYTNIDVCKTIKTYCAVCGTQGEDREVPHDVEGQEWKDLDSTATCTEAGELTQYKKCNVCEGYGAKQTVPAEATGHDFYEYDEKDSTCSTEGHIAYKECGNCSNMFAADAADDEAMENALDYDEVFKAIDPEAHIWVEYEESEADCDNAGYAEDHKFCSECYLFVIGEEATDIVVDWGAFYEEEYDEDGNVTPIGEGAIAGEKEAALYEEILAEYLAENGLELPEMPAEDASFEEWMEYYDARSEVMNQVDWEEFDAIWTPIADEIWTEAFHNYFLAAAAEDEDLGDLVVPALGHNLVKVDKVEATYDKEGTEAHWACENCDKLFADEDGAQEVTAEELVIAKLVKEEEKGDNITEDKKDDTSTNDKAEGDKSTTSPATGETVATVAAAVAAIIAAGFVLVRKAKKA